MPTLKHEWSSDHCCFDLVYIVKKTAETQRTGSRVGNGSKPATWTALVENGYLIEVILLAVLAKNDEVLWQQASCILKMYMQSNTNNDNANMLMLHNVYLVKMPCWRWLINTIYKVQVRIIWMPVLNFVFHVWDLWSSSGGGNQYLYQIPSQSIPNNFPRNHKSQPHDDTWGEVRDQQVIRSLSLGVQK